MLTAKRLYISPLREQAAERTREEILRRATDLFARRGYGRVTVKDIADAAGVAAKTVFASVGSKADILDRIVAGGVAASGHSAAMREVLGTADPRTALELLAAGTRAGNEGQWTVHEAVFKAVPVHEDGEALWHRATDEYRQAMHAAAVHLHTLDPAPPYSPAETGDLLWYWFGPTGWRTLVLESDWTWDRAHHALLRTALDSLYPPTGRTDSA